MAYFSNLRGLISILFMASILSGASAAGYNSVVYYKPSVWKSAHATFYGDETARETMGMHFIEIHKFCFVISKGLVQ